MGRIVDLASALGEWPPKNAASTEDSPTIEPTDIIADARLSNGEHLVLNLTRGALQFTSSVCVRDEIRVVLAGIVDDIIGRSIQEAGLLSFNLP